MFNSVYANSRRLGQSPEWAHAADAIPRKPFAGRLAFSFISLQEAGHEELLRQSGQFRTTGLAIADDQIRVVEINNLDDGPRLRCVVANFVAVGRRDGFRTRK